MFTASATSMNIPTQLQGMYFFFCLTSEQLLFSIHAILLAYLSGIARTLIYFTIYLSLLPPKPSDKAVSFKFLHIQHLRNIA